MKKTNTQVFLAITFFLFAASFSHMNAQSCSWAKKAASYSAIAADGNGNVYMTGSFGPGTLILGTDTLVSKGSLDVYIAKYDINGNIIWAKGVGGTGSDEGTGIALDASGNVYITGSFTSSKLGFGTDTISLSGSSSIFLTKYDANGTIQWANNVGGTGSDASTAITVDASNNVYITGSFSSATITFGTTVLINSSNQNIFLAKYDNIGGFLFAKSAVGTATGGSASVATDVNENVYITGSFGDSFEELGTLIFGADTIRNNSYGEHDVFITKYDYSGNVQWVKGVSTTGMGGINEGKSITTDATGNIYITGYFSSTTIIFGSTTLTRIGSEDVFIAKYDANGTVIWAKGAGGSSDDEAYGVTTDRNGNAIITGYFDSPTLGFGSDTIINKNNNGAAYIFFAKYDPNGNVLLAKSIGGTGINEGLAIASDGIGSFYVSGNFASPTIIFGSDTLTTGAGFLYKYHDFSSGISGTLPSCVGLNNATATALPVGISPYTYLWSNGETTSIATALAPGKYSVIVRDSLGCATNDTVNILSSTNQITNVLSKNICLGDSYQVGSYVYTSAGSYHDTLTASSGCDSIVILNLTVTAITNNVSKIICPGDSIQVGTHTYKSAGTYHDTLSTLSVCDSVVILQLTIGSLPSVTINPASVCNSAGVITVNNPNPTYNYHWSTGADGVAIPISAIGTYTVTATDTNGCKNTNTVTATNASNCEGFLQIVSDPVVNYFDTIHVSVQIWGGQSIFSTYAELHFDSSLMHMVGNSVGDYLGGSIINSPPVVTGGKIDFGMTKLSGAQGADGNGTIYNFTFALTNLPSGITFNPTSPNFITTVFSLTNISVYDTLGTHPPSFNSLSIVNSNTIITYYVAVWPGDLNNDKTVNAADILPIGYFYNTTGPIRPNGSLAWSAQLAPLWGFNQTNRNNSAYATFADGNADGVINLADQAAIGFNLSRSHARMANEFVGYPVISSTSISDPPLWVDITIDTIQQGSLPYSLNVPVKLGTSLNPVDSLYGLAFDIYFDPNCVNTYNIQLNFTSFFGTLNTDYIQIIDSSQIHQGRISVGFTRYNSSELTAAGDVIMNVTFDVTQTCGTGWLKIAPLVLSCNTKYGNPISLSVIDDSVKVGDISAGISESPVNDGYKIYPNPASNTVTIEKVDGKNTLQLIELIDMQGRIVRSFNSNILETTGDKIILPLENISGGFFNVRLISSDHVAYSHLIIIGR